MNPEAIALVAVAAVAFAAIAALVVVLVLNRDSAKARAIVQRAEMQNERDKAVMGLGLALDANKTKDREIAALTTRAKQAEANYAAELAKHIADVPSDRFDALHDGVLDSGDPGTSAAPGAAPGRPAEHVPGPFPPRRPAVGDDADRSGTLGEGGPSER